MNPVAIESKQFPNEPPLILAYDDARIEGPTRTEIAVRFCEVMLPNLQLLYGETDIPSRAVQLTDQLIEELKKEKSNG